MKRFLFFTAIMFTTLSYNAWAQDSSETIVDVKTLSYEDARANKQVVIELLESKVNASMTDAERNAINLEIYRRGYGHQIDQWELDAIRVQIQTLRNNSVTK